ncbi:MAG TPA: hypothetical protein VGY58_16015 [Gemmataceae bacterium]|nr:hypothetical protein [Gemmataceae bacterium]
MSKGGTLIGEGYTLEVSDWTLIRELPFEATVRAQIKEGGFGGWFITRDGIDKSSEERTNAEDLERRILGIKCGWLELFQEGKVLHRKHVYPSGSNFVSYLLSPKARVLDFVAHEISEEVLGIVLPQVER